MLKQKMYPKSLIIGCLFALLLSLFVTKSQATNQWEQSWSGKLKVNEEVSLTLIFHISRQRDGYSAKLDSVEQGAIGIAANHVKINGERINIRFPSIGAIFKGTKKEQRISGTFRQAGKSLPLDLNPISKALQNQMTKMSTRPQEPQGPYPYVEEEVSYPHIKQKFTFAGTFTKPKGKGPFTTVILASGSGPQDRDSNIFNHKPFKVLADHLTTAGFAVLRADDRGTGQSGGDFSQANLVDFSYDIESAFEYLKARPDVANIGILGHSEGGMTAPIFAARQPKVAFVISLAGVVVPGDQLWATQQQDLAVASGSPNGKEIYKTQLQAAKLAASGASSEQLTALFNTIPNIHPSTVKALSGMLTSKWGRSFMSFEPHRYWSKLNMPILAINGELDIQVDAQDNLKNIRNIMSNTANADVTTINLPNLNHLFQKAQTGNVNEYGKITETINDKALKTISDWLRARF